MKMEDHLTIVEITNINNMTVIDTTMDTATVVASTMIHYRQEAKVGARQV